MKEYLSCPTHAYSNIVTFLVSWKVDLMTLSQEILRM